MTHITYSTKGTCSRQIDVDINDNSIIETAGLGLAVSNACESLKAAADEIICSNEEHALAYVAAHYL